MKVIDIIKKNYGKTISIEVEPPILGGSIKQVCETIYPLVELGVSYIDITYHPKDIIKNGNGDVFYQRKRPGTNGVAGAIKNKCEESEVITVPHVICTGFTKEDIQDTLIELSYHGIESIMALRGDPPKINGRLTKFKPEKNGYSYAKDLIKQIVDLKEGKYLEGLKGEPIDFCIGAACYPEGYYKGQTADENIEWTKAKVDSGADYLVTQLFFNNDAYLKFVEESKIDVPIIPGIFPISLYGHVEKLPAVFGCEIPDGLIDKIERYRGNEQDIKKIGIEECIKQCNNLLDNGAPSLHFFANRGAPIEEVIKNLYD
ncbi:MAG: methylenetetrahydrofolate reductase [Candidatus Nanoarchaeia archaeon]|nr:methylenetetrahydrofolate reductase [Candidatus Nanoarchaeia archaeon]